MESASSWCPELSAPALLPREHCPACAAGIRPSNATVWVPVVLHSVYNFENRRWGIAQDRGTWLLPLTLAAYSKNSEALDRGDSIWSADRVGGYGIKVERLGVFRWTDQGLREALSRFPVPLLVVDPEGLKALAGRCTREPGRESKG